MTRAEDVSVLFVAQKRSAGVSWAHLARMAGCSEAALRARHDPAAMKAAGGARETLTDRDRVVAALVENGMGSDEAAILARIWMSNGATVSERDAVRGHLNGGDTHELIGDVRRQALRLGVKILRKGSGFAMPTESVVTLSKLARIGGRR